MTDFLFGSITGDLKAADEAFAQARKSGDMLEQQRACAFALAALQRAFPVGYEFNTLMRVSVGLQRVIDGQADPLFTPLKGGRKRPTPERQMDGLIVAFVRLYTEAGMARAEAFKKVAQMFAAAGALSHGGGRRMDSDHAGISRTVTEGSVRSLWAASRKGKRLEPVGEYGDDTVRRLRNAGLPTRSISDLDALFTSGVSGLVDLLTTPSASETAD